jgi:nucleoside-diphosphate-sugar epimerase
MAETTKRFHVVFGSSGGVGSALVRELHARDKRVRAVTHSARGQFPEGVEVVRGDATDAASAREAGRGAAVIYHAVNVPYPQWQGKLPPILDANIGAAARAEAKLVYADNLYMYGRVHGPMTEETPYNPASRKGALRARMADELMSAHKEGRVRAAIGRASDFYGPGPLNSVAGERLFEAVLEGKKAMWVGDLDAPHTLTYIEDFAKTLATLGEREEALGEVWHVPSPEPITGRKFIELVFDEARRPPRFGTYNRTMMRLGGLFSSEVREFREMLYQFEAPFVLDSSKYARVFGDVVPTPYREGIARTLQWYRGEQRNRRAGPVRGKDGR